MIPPDPTPAFTPSGFNSEFASPADYAQLYRLRGMQVVPAYMPGEPRGGLSWKRPLLKAWVEYQEALVPDELFGSWYGRTGAYAARWNMGMITGRASDNLFVIDLDLYKTPAAAAWWNGLMAIHNNNMDLETVEQRTGGGGSQKIYRAPPGWTVPNRAIHSTGIDIKGQGGFVMLPPSHHESGKRYVWLDGQCPDDLPPTLAPDWLLEAVAALVEKHGGLSSGNGGAAAAPPQAGYDALEGHLVDGRESYMRDTVWAAVTDWYRDCPIKPSESESRLRCAEKYLIYEDHVEPQGSYPPGLSKIDQLELEGRGPVAFHVKWQATMKQWETKVRDAAMARPAKPFNKNDGPVNTRDYRAEGYERGPVIPPSVVPYPYLDVDQIMDKPDPVWAVEDLINERALGFIFGPPGSLKTFLALDLALSMAAKAPTWWGRRINSPGAVVYLCREGTSSFKFRIQAWEQHRGLRARGTPFYLVEHPTNFMRPEDRLRVMATIEAVAAKAGVPIAAIMVDTVSRVLPGAKENQQEDMSLFIEACEDIQQRFNCVVIGLHHTNKTGGIRGSTVIPGAGDFLIETRREPGAVTGSIVLAKIKDGEDGMELGFKVTKLDLAGAGALHSSLVIDPTNEPVKLEPGLGWPDIAICREILSEIDRQWWGGSPWCYAINSSRSAVVNIMNRWQLRRNVVKDMLAKWTANRIIEEVERDAKTHVKGYKKLTNI